MEVQQEEIRVGFDAKRIVRNSTGLGSYGRTLVNDLAAIGGIDLHLYAPDAGLDHLRTQVAEADNVHYHYPHHFQPIGKSYWRSHGMVKQMLQDGMQVYHGLSGELPVGISQSGVRSVVTIHDLIFMRHPEYYNSIDVRIYTRKFRRTLLEADSIVAISECTRRDICELGDIDPDRVQLIYQSCATRFASEPAAGDLWRVRDTYNLPDRYILCVGTIEERKNALLAVEALHHLPDEVSLVLVGRSTSYAEMLFRRIMDDHLSARVLMLHHVPDQDLPALYRMAEAFVYPSRYEGFGIPVIEAIRMGLPVVACTGSCLEEAGGPDSLYVSPDDPAALANAVTSVLYGAQGRNNRIEAARQYVKRFENTGAAQQFADLYRSLI